MKTGASPYTEWNSRKRFLLINGTHRKPGVSVIEESAAHVHA